MENQVEEVKSKVDIVSLISEYIELKKAGRNYKANCPFHGEKTASFMVSPDLQIYKCFGCGESGDAFTFLQRHEGMDFGEALKFLADKVGIKLKSFSPTKTTEREKNIEINNSALSFYNYVLLKHPQGKKILNYLKKDRGLTQESVEMFKIGYSPDKPGVLFDFLSKKRGYNAPDLGKSGLFAGRNYDRFEGRVVFPLMDHRGNIVGFSGRMLPWVKQDRAKYINSPETASYHKSKVLYGLNVSKQEIRSKGYAIVVEGELDMISPYQHGFKNIVAIKGSALTEDQIMLLSRFCNKIIFCLDADFAGDEAAKRASIMAENKGLEVQVARLTKYKDPDEAVKNDSKSFENDIKNAVGIWDFLVDSVFEKYDLTGAGKAKISKEVVPLLNRIDDAIVRSHYCEIVAQKLSVPVESVVSQLKSSSNKDFYQKKDEEGNGDIAEEKPRRQLLEERLLYLILNFYPEKILEEEYDSLFSLSFILKIVDLLKKNKYIKNLDVKKFFNSLPRELQSRFSEMMFFEIEKNELKDVVRELKILTSRKSLERLGVKIQEAETSNDQKGLEKYQKLFSQEAKKLSDLEEEN